MRHRSIRTVVGRFHRRPTRYAELADCRDELALIAEHRRSEPLGHFTL